jgi:hypothetical protein
MNIIDAVKSGRRFKRRHHIRWFEKYDGCPSERFHYSDHSILCELIVDDILATDWAIEGRDAGITKADFSEFIIVTGFAVIYILIFIYTLY